MPNPKQKDKHPSKSNRKDWSREPKTGTKHTDCHQRIDPDTGKETWHVSWQIHGSNYTTVLVRNTLEEANALIDQLWGRSKSTQPQHETQHI